MSKTIVACRPAAAVILALALAAPGCSKEPIQLVKVAICGNQVLEPGEECDGAELDELTCEGLGFASGRLACTTECTLDTAACEPCGNGVVEAGEDCDGTDMGVGQCSDYGDFVSGSLACTPDCTYNLAACELPPLAYGGDYGMLSIYDLSAALPDQVHELHDILADPGGFVIDGITGAVYAWFCVDTPVVSAACQFTEGLGVNVEGIIRAQITDAVTDYIQHDTLYMDRMAAAIDAGTDFMKHVEVASDVTITPDIGKPTDFTAYEEWVDITFLWDYECAPGDTACSRHTFAVDTLDMHQSVLEDTYTGTTNEPNMSLGTGGNPRVFIIEYGLLIEVFYEQVLIPRVTNDQADSMSDLAAWLVNCPGLAAGISDADGDTQDGGYTISLGVAGLGYTLPEQTISDMCTGVATNLGSRLEERLESMIDLGASEMITSGNCTMVDTDVDYVVEEAVDGVWDGTLERRDSDSGTDTSLFPVTGSFSAVADP